MHHPYESYDTVVNFLDTASSDPRVLSMKQTLYRTNTDSPIAEALLDAAGKKEVAVVVELKASFDEASNIHWARSLEDAGVQVSYGLAGLKTHAKLALIVRNDPDGKIRRYAHLGTGNYNPSTARFYSDFSLFTSDEEITSAVHDVFNFLTANSEQPHYKPLIVAPRDMAKTVISMIDREARHARRGRAARMIIKMNAVVDPPVIQALYRASQAGVEIDLIVRGQCALVPGVRGLSSKIRVRSIVGRFLEHSRIYYFENGGKPELYPGQRRLDAAQSLRTRRSDVPAQGPATLPARLQRNFVVISRRHAQSSHSELRWHILASPCGEKRARFFGAGAFHAAGLRRC